MVEKYYKCNSAIIIMASSIKVRQDTKSEIERLQAEILLRFGKKITQQKLIDLIVKFSKERLDDIMDEPKEEVFNKNKLKEIIKIRSDWEVETSPEMIDEVVYDGDQE